MPKRLCIEISVNASVRIQNNPAMTPKAKKYQFAFRSAFSDGPNRHTKTVALIAVGLSTFSFHTR